MYNRVSAAAACRASTIIAFAVTSLVLAPSGASAAKLRDIHDFSSCLDFGCNGVNGNNPLVGDASGTFFGAINEGGDNGVGEIFEMIPGSHGGYRYKSIYSFCPQGVGDCSGGYTPNDLIVDVNGNLYGTTQGGGAFGGGTVFELKRGKRAWKYSVLYNFCSANTGNCPDGAVPNTGLSYAGESMRFAWDGTSPLFGTTGAGGTNDVGLVYKLVRNGSQWSEQPIYKFSGSGGNAAAGPLAVDSSGNVYGASSGGTNGNGWLFRLAHDTWKPTVLHQFCSLQNCADGASPIGEIVILPSGDIFGAAGNSGAHNFGVVYQLKPTSRGYRYNVYYDFCTYHVGFECRDGAQPTGVAYDPTGSGSLVGTTSWGDGALFRIQNGGFESVLHSFCEDPTRPVKCIYFPAAKVIIDANGSIFGETWGGGTAHLGAIFQYEP